MSVACYRRNLFMPYWKLLLLTLYYHATQPVRWWCQLRALATGRVPVAVLFYHRVAEVADNPWTVSHRMFRRQLAWLQRNFQIVPLKEAQRRIGGGRNRQPCVSITFDDGYADNCQQALPLLLRQRLPFTYFITLHNVLSGEPFPHDLIWGKPCPPNNLEQIRALADAGAEIASHGLSHCDLGAIEDQRLLSQEICDSRQHLQRLIDRPVRYFAFPFGQPRNVTRLAIQVAQEAGYDAVCSAWGGLNFPGDDAFHLLRIGVDNDLIGLKNAATGDPRKLLRRPRALPGWGTAPAADRARLLCR